MYVWLNVGCENWWNEIESDQAVAREVFEVAIGQQSQRRCQYPHTMQTFPA